MARQAVGWLTRLLLLGFLVGLLFWPWWIEGRGSASAEGPFPDHTLWVVFVVLLSTVLLASRRALGWGARSGGQ